MRIDHKLQIDAIKGVSLFYQEYGNLVLISDGKIGAYLSEKDLKIDKTKMKKATLGNKLDPDVLRSERIRARETHTAIKWGNKLYIKLKAFNMPNFCYVNETFLKMFPKYGELFIRGEADPVYIEKLGEPYGVILPVHVSKEEE